MEGESKDPNLGALLCVGFQGTTVTPQAYHLITKLRVSSMILSRKNTLSVKQISKLIRDLQYIAYNKANYKYPILFAVDEEGGMLNSIFDPDFITQLPGAMALAATGDTELVYKVLKAIAIELKTIGFLIILGPVLDVITKLSHQLVGVRSFGSTLEDVKKYGRACAKGLKDGGLLTVGKHFPGIGNASVDSLLELPMMTDSLDQIRLFNSVPFADLINEKLLDGISVAGCGVPVISPDETHACLSPVIVNQLLRQEIGFDGVAISECLEMDALHHSIGLGQGVILSISAGCDLIMVCHNLDLQNEAADALTKAVENGNLEEETISTSLRRIEKFQKTLPSWNEIFPPGFDINSEIVPFKVAQPNLWSKHQKLAEVAYEKSVSLIRDYNDTLPVSKYLVSNANNENNNILILSPLLMPIYLSSSGSKNIYAGEEIFQKFGKLLNNHPINSDQKYNVLHTTYTANGLTALHESLIEHSKVVIVLTSEASRNMYQIGIVKYVSVLCGANPASVSGGSATFSQLIKPLIIVATLSPYDFFYNKYIGSSYLCCYDYTPLVLEKLVGVLMGDIIAEGSIPGEKKFISKQRKRKLLDEKSKKLTIPKRRWLVEEFNLFRDWTGLKALWKNNMTKADYDFNMGGKENEDKYFEKLYLLLSTKEQKHFVIRNSSLNILYGIILTWVEDYLALNGDLTTESKNGSIIYLLVDRAKRMQSIGKNLHSSAIRYLKDQQKCKNVSLGSSFPLVSVFESTLFLQNNKFVSFMNNSGWDITVDSSKMRQVMLLDDIKNWLVSKKIFRELMIVGVRFDICTDPEKLLNLINRSIDTDEKNNEDLLRAVYLEALKYLKSKAPYGVKVIIAIEPTNQNVIGSIILFSNKSQLSKFYPFMDDCGCNEDEIIGGLSNTIIDPLYSNLTEIFRFGLICSGITFLKTSFNEENKKVNKCLFLGMSSDKSLEGIQEIGFSNWRYYYPVFDLKSDLDRSFL